MKEGLIRKRKIEEKWKIKDKFVAKNVFLLTRHSFNTIFNVRRVNNNKKSRKSEIFVKFCPNFQRALLRVPVGRSGCFIAHFLCLESSSNTLLKIFRWFNAEIQPNVSKSNLQTFLNGTIWKNYVVQNKMQWHFLILTMRAMTQTSVTIKIY